MEIELFDIKDCATPDGPAVCFSMKLNIEGLLIRCHANSRNDLIREINRELLKKSQHRTLDREEIDEIANFMENNSDYINASIRLIKRINEYVNENVKNVVVSKPTEFIVDVEFLEFKKYDRKTVDMYFKNYGRSLSMRIPFSTFLNDQQSIFNTVISDIVISSETVPRLHDVKYSERTYISFFSALKQFVNSKNFTSDLNKACNNALSDSTVGRLYMMESIMK